MSRPETETQRFELIDFDALAAVPCPCGQSRRSLAEADDVPLTIHRVDISKDARLHYHKRLREVYYILDCQPDAKLQLDDELVDLKPGMCVLIRPGVRHRAIGQMQVLNIVSPKFDPQDEWFD